MDKIASVISIIFLAIIIIIVFFLAVGRFDRYLNIKAIEVCSNNSKFVKNDSGDSSSAQYPITEFFNNCIDKTK